MSKIDSHPLNYFAGANAFQRIREEGLTPEMIEMIVGAAGGPKWLILSHLDRYIFGNWISNRARPLHLIGASIGAWRFAAAAQPNPAKAIKRLEDDYIHQSYSAKPSRAEVSGKLVKIIHHFLSDDGGEMAINHPFMRLHILTTKSRGLTKSDGKIPLTLGMAGTALLNLFSRKAIRVCFERALFYHPHDIPPFYNISDFPIQKIPLSSQNLPAVLFATGSIPFLMGGVSQVPGAPPGAYWDGGITDYHLHLAMRADAAPVATPEDLDKLIEWVNAGTPTGGAQLEGEHLFATERLVVSPATGIFTPLGSLGDGAAIDVGTVLGHVGEHEVRSPFAGLLQSYIAVDTERVTTRQPIAWLRTS